MADQGTRRSTNLSAGQSGDPIKRLEANQEALEDLYLSRRKWIILIGLIALAALILCILCFNRQGDLMGGDEVFSNSSRITVTRRNPNSDETFLTLGDVHGIFGFANYTCEPAGAVQFIQASTEGNIIGLQESWFKVILRDTIENTAPNIISLEDNLYTIDLAEPGAYMVNSMVITSVPLGFDSFSISTCLFIDVNAIGLYDILRRVAPQCSNPALIGDEDFGPLLLMSSTDWFSITTPSKMVLRYILLSDAETQVAIVAARVKVLKI